MEKPFMASGSENATSRVWELFVCAGGCCRGIETEGEVRKAGQDSGTGLVLRGRPGFSPCFLPCTA